MLPISLRRLLDAFAGCFTTPTFAVFHAMILGLVAQTGQRTVCGMLTGAGLATSWTHDRAHRFFSTARWQVDQIGLIVFDLVLAHLVTDGADLLVAVDDTAHRRRGKKVHGAGWIHDGSAPSRNKLAFGHRWVVVGVIVQLSFLSRPVCLPVLCRRWQGKRHHFHRRTGRADDHDPRRAGARPACACGRRRRLSRHQPAGPASHRDLDDQAAPQRRVVSAGAGPRPAGGAGRG
jgi:DDE superfamily endonuclease